ncbi:MAG TPA: MBL fold metallo-hydrolase [Rhizomicrobium sp.]|jgi:glyoxylase-like metal-dependent hydrolase (beta-lactamase superfamily II)
MTRAALHFDQSLPAVYGVAERLSPRIERLLAHNPSPFTFRGTGVYLVGDDRQVAVIDPGPNLPEHLAALKAAIGGRHVTHILITHTHRDHSPAAAPLKQATGAKTYGYGPHVFYSPSGLRIASGAGRDEKVVEEGGDRDFVPDIAVKDGDVIIGDGYRFDCVFTPGHTSNHMCYALAEEHALFTGDHVMGWSTTVVAPPDGDMGAYMRSLEKLIARQDRILYPTHGSPITKPKSFLRAYLAHRRMREGQIQHSLKQGKKTAPELIAILYAGLKPALHRAAALTVEAHLKHMTEDGRIRALPDGRYELSAAR